MENRFGIKDLILYLFIAALIVLVALNMVLTDRQHKDIVKIKDQTADVRNDIAALNRRLSSGVPMASGGSGTGASQGDDVFTHLHEAEAMPDFSRGDWLIDNFGTKIGRLTPLVSTDVYQVWVESQVMESLVSRDPFTLEFVPRVATRWEESEDGLTVRFYLRNDVVFSDGAPLTVDDVIFTVDWILNPQVNADRDRLFMSQVKEKKKIDDYTIEFRFKEYNYQNFLTVAGMSIMPKHFYSRFTPDQYNEKTGLLLGSGPYRLENPETWSPGQPVQIVRNERYWGPPGTFDRIVFKEVQGETTEMVLFGNQEHDIIRCVPEQYVKLKNDARIAKFSDAYEYDSVYSGYIYCGWNQLKKRNGKSEPTFFADKRVRKAMTMLLDRERMGKEVFLGYATVASGPFAPNGPQSDPGIKPLPYDEKAAKALLAEAGFADRNGDGVLESKEGKMFKFTLSYPSGSETWEKVVLSMKDYYARAGIVMEPDRVDWPVLVQRLKLSDFDAATLGWSSTPESDPYQVFHSDAIRGQGDNRVHYSNPELDKVIEKARTTVDRDERMKLWQEVHRILHEDQPNTFLFNRKALRLFNNRIKNVKPSAAGLNFEYLNGGMIPWYVPKDLQRYTQ